MLLRPGILIVLAYCVQLACSTKFDLFPQDLPRIRFDGIGALSGGGATSKLLFDYDDKTLNEILDYLFKPGFGASMHILKVEIGGDSQSTEGTEASHMHTSTDLNFHRGYEWRLMLEAKKRNPDILLYGLPWAFPGWVGEGSGNPYKYNHLTAQYVANWVKGAKDVYNLTIDYVGIWNERDYDLDYIITLRFLLDEMNLRSTKIAVADSFGWNIAKDVPKIKGYIAAIGTHYPGTTSSQEAQQCGLPLWSAEDYSTFNDDVGSGCLARILNQNFVNGKMTSTIVWNLIASYFDTLPYPRCSLMTANSPWSGHYEVTGPLWMMAHTTQFTKPGWNYVDYGKSGLLPKGGSIVMLTDPTETDVTIVMETLTHDHSICIRPSLPPYNVSTQPVTFNFTSFPHIQTVSLWMSELEYGSDTSSSYFRYETDVPIPSSRLVTFNVPPDYVITLTSLKVGSHGSYPNPRPDTTFPLPYMDNFERYNISEEPSYITPQIGSYEVLNGPLHADKKQAASNKALFQTVTQKPIDWCDQKEQTIALFGPGNWTNAEASIQVNLMDDTSTNAVFLASRVSDGGCGTVQSSGIFFWLRFDNQSWSLDSTFSSATPLKQMPFAVKRNEWYTLYMRVNAVANTVDLSINDVSVLQAYSLPAGSKKGGFIAFGTGSFAGAFFDNFVVYDAY